jgi:hypothetical protein
MNEPHLHHHDPGHGHPPAAARSSLLRLSVSQRLVFAGAAIALLWAAAFWAMH